MLSFKSFFEGAPFIIENRNLIKGSICGIKLEAIEASLMRDIRYLDKLVDGLARGKPFALVLRG